MKKRRGLHKHGVYRVFRRPETSQEKWSKIRKRKRSTQEQR
jgi:hypothetical protein